jgi:hypothetical protein
MPRVPEPKACAFLVLCFYVMISFLERQKRKKKKRDPKSISFTESLTWK